MCEDDKAWVDEFNTHQEQNKNMINQLSEENKQLKENIEALQHELKMSTACGIRIQEENKALSDRIINFKIFIGAVWESLPEDVKEHWARVQL